MTLLDVTLTCPSCGHTWLEAQIDPASWWGTVRPEQIAQQTYCRKCQHRTPMRVVGEQKQARRFA